MRVLVGTDGSPGNEDAQVAQADGRLQIVMTYGNGALAVETAGNGDEVPLRGLEPAQAGFVWVARDFSRQGY